MAAAAQLNYAGHTAVVFERDEAVGGLLRFGIPDFKLEKSVIDRRVKILEAEGVEFRTGIDVGVDITTEALLSEFDAIVIAVGARLHRQIDVPGSKLEGVHLAMDYLYDRNRAVAAGLGHGRHEGAITAAGKHVVVIGGGDTAADCIANSHREGALSVTQLDRYPAPRGTRPRDTVGWPNAPRRELSSYALEEGGAREWEAVTQRLVGKNGKVTELELAKGAPPDFHAIAGTQKTIPADLVLIAVGFERPERDAFMNQIDVAEDQRGNVKADAYVTSRPRVFACGDARRGASLVVWAINEGRECAEAVCRHLEQQPR
jgi:glutamate synthase (NADPH/NADH) small chain